MTQNLHIFTNERTNEEAFRLKTPVRRFAYKLHWQKIVKIDYILFCFCVLVFAERALSGDVPDDGEEIGAAVTKLTY